MPNDAHINFQACLCSLEKLQNGPEDAVFSTKYKDHLNLLQSLNTLLSNKTEVTPTDAERVLRICLQYATDVRFVPSVLSIISELIDIDKDNPIVDFFPFSLAILKILRTMSHEDNTSKLRLLSFQVLMRHPKSTLTKLIRENSPDVIQTFQQFFGLNKAVDLETKIQSFELLRKLQWLPANEKKLFVETGVSLWLVGVIPATVQIMASSEDVDKVEACLTFTEMLVEELVLIDYYQNPDWQSLLENTANSKMFPATIKGLLEKGKDNWHRIWIVLIKLLKSQMTHSYSTFGSPINSMLPIVEAAFKKESTQRVRAFACWNELIEIFSHETGSSASKTIKLLIIPLKANNTRTEETAEVKFQTWWLFIQKFRHKIPKFTNEILISFLHFMFGKQQATNHIKAQEISHSLSMKCIEAFAEIMGHIHCSDCVTSLTPLNGNITTTILIMDHWNDFLFALKCCICAVTNSYTTETKGKIRCIWNSFVMRLADMAENTLRQDMFDDLINIVSELISNNKLCGNKCLMEILVDDITLTLFREEKLKTLTKSSSQTHQPMHRIVKLIMDDKFYDYFKRLNSEELTRLLQPLISTLLEESTKKPEYIIGLLDELSVTNSALLMWTALAHESKESKLSPEAFTKILIWPFKTVHVSFEVKKAAEAWYTLYNIIQEKLEETDFHNEISKVLTRPVEDSKASNYFVLFALIGVLKHKPNEEKMAKLEALTYEINDYNDFEQLLTPLVKTIVLMMNDSTDENLAQITINCVENILRVIKSKPEAIGCQIPIQKRENFSNIMANIPKINESMLAETITLTLKTMLEKCPYESIKKQVRSLLSSYNKTESTKKVSESPENTRLFGFNIPPKEFASPKIKKKTKKEASIVNTVVENGEEYVVVKSNWKFNPKNLTENQKEKLQRKRDIPALYQDLSQSQDEFKLTTWKTDSQDASLSTSKSTTDASNDVSDTLNKVTNSDIVPRIMENMLDIQKTSKLRTDADVTSIANVNTPKADKLSAPGNTKSPRMALKDRVFRNVRNLIGNSSLSPQDKVTEKQKGTRIPQNVSISVSEPELDCTESPAKKVESNEKISKPCINNDTLTNDKEKESLVTSRSKVRMKKLIVSTPRIDQIVKLVCAPLSKGQEETNLELSHPQISVDRPTRLKRPPKKYDDSLVLGIKKGRYSKTDLHSQNLLEGHTETVVAQIHNQNDKSDGTVANSPQKDVLNGDKTSENANKSPNATDNVIFIENVTSCAASDNTIHKNTEKTLLISPITPSINKPTQKSPEKPSTGEVPSSLSKASEGDVDVKDKQNANKTFSKTKELQKTSDKNVGAQYDTIIDHTYTHNKSPSKCIKLKVQKEITAYDENTAGNIPVITNKDLNQLNTSAKKGVPQNDTDKHVENSEVVPTPLNKTIKDSDISLPLCKPHDLQNTPKKVGAQHDVNTDHMDTPNISLRKFRKSIDQKEITAHDENTAVITPVTNDKNLTQPKIPTNEVLQNDIDKNVENFEVVSSPINKTKKDSDISLLPLCKSQGLQNIPTKVGVQKDVRTDHMKIRKFKKSIDQKEISANNENTAIITPITNDKDLTQPKISAKKGVLQNNSVKNVEKVEVVAKRTGNQTKTGSDTSIPLSKRQELQITPKKVNKPEKHSNTRQLKSAKKSFSLKYSDQNENTSYKETENNKNEENLLITPKHTKNKKSRIEKELAIDMVEGHPFLQTQSEKRLTRNKLIELGKRSKRKTLVDKLNKSKLEHTPKTPKKDNKTSPSVESIKNVENSQNKALSQSLSTDNVMDESPCSEDVIESSQDSTMTTISAKGNKRTPKCLPVATLNKIPHLQIQNLLETLDKPNKESQITDIELPANKSVESDEKVVDLTESMDTEAIGDSKNTTDLTENMDTEPVAANDSDDVIFLSESLPMNVSVNSESKPGPETQEIAEADTQPNDPKKFAEWEINKPLLASPNSNAPESLAIQDNDLTQSLPEADLILANIGDSTDVSSPFKDDNQRKKDFLNNTVEISPIKVQSPDRAKKSPSPETSGDFVVIQLSSPVHSNGEPFEKQCSPEFFTDDKVSSENQNVSPPRFQVTHANSSPSASLSLKKNRPQLNRPSSGRAAQMLGLLSASRDPKNKKVPEFEKADKCRDLNEFYYLFDEENACNEDNFLQLQRTLPTFTSSPSGPILKRKLVDITDESTTSPASKRKRVSFHDPPVSTTVSVQKYIEPISLMRSPQTPAKKRQTRSAGKSPKKLDNAFLDSALSQTVESFTEATTPSDETENISLDVTPAVEIVKSSELNDTDPICPDLINCTDPIDVIAIELSSAAMRDLFVKEMEGKVNTVGDLAKMTELEVNRLCIKAPKITVAKKVLMDYIANRPAIAVETVIEEAFSEPMTESLHECKADVEMQTDKVEVSSKSTQVQIEQAISAETQTDIITRNTSIQTVESGTKTTKEIIDSCLAERGDFLEKLTEILNNEQLQTIAGMLSVKTLFKLIMTNNDESSTTLVHRILKHQCKGVPKSNKTSAELTFFKELFLNRYGTADLALLCSQILQSLFDKPA